MSSFLTHKLLWKNPWDWIRHLRQKKVFAPIWNFASIFRVKKSLTQIRLTKLCRSRTIIVTNNRTIVKLNAKPYRAQDNVETKMRPFRFILSKSWRFISQAKRITRTQSHVQSFTIEICRPSSKNWCVDFDMRDPKRKETWSADLKYHAKFSR